MWYFTWILGTGFAIFFTVFIALFHEIKQDNVVSGE
jgi:cyd operon protein YbgT